MTPFPHRKETSQEAGGTPGVKKFQRKLQMNFKGDFFWDTLYDQIIQPTREAQESTRTINDRQSPTWGREKIFRKKWTLALTRKQRKKIGFFVQKPPNLAQELAFLAQYWPFWPICCHARLKNNAKEVPRRFSDMWVQKLLLHPKK